MDSTSRRRLGAYYTPDTLATALVSWSLEGKPGRILDPSFGGCSFLRASTHVLRALGAENPDSLVFGIDIDEAALGHVQPMLDAGMPASNIAIGDFFHVRPQSTFPDLFDAVVGNPPYIRHHWFQGTVRDRATNAALRAGIRLSGRADAWAYFIAHSISFLKPGGSLAFVLPCSLLQAHYGQAILESLQSRFAAVQCIRLMERVFRDTLEPSVVLLARDLGGGPAEWRYQEVGTAAGLQATLNSRITVPPHERTTVEDWKGQVIEPAARSVLRDLLHAQDMPLLGSLAQIRLGVVTGANAFFLRSKRDAVAWAARGVRLVPVVPRGGWLSNARWTSADLREGDGRNLLNRLLVIDPDTQLPPHLRERITAAESEGRHSGYKCRARQPWYALRDARAPDAFLPYMGSEAPHLSLNCTSATCTNAIHRLWWQGTQVDGAAVVLGSWTTLFVLQAELYGRSYSGGVLKLEPSGASRIRVPLVSGAHRSLQRVDTMARRSGREAAIELADELVLQGTIGMKSEQVTALRKAVSALRALRTPSKGA